MSAKEDRTKVGVDIILSMMVNEEFPISNIYRLSKTMMEYYETEGHEDSLRELGYTWTPDADYWRRHLMCIRDNLRKHRKLYLEYVRDFTGEEITGQWKFLRKAEYETTLSGERKGLSTRADNYNDKAKDGHDNGRWKTFNAPLLEVEEVLLSE